MANASNRAAVYYGDRKAGTLTKLGDGFEFAYEARYLVDPQSKPTAFPCRYAPTSTLRRASSLLAGRQRSKRSTSNRCREKYSQVCVHLRRSFFTFLFALGACSFGDQAGLQKPDVRELIAALDEERSVDRDRAQEELLKRGGQVVPQLKSALAGAASLEAKERIYRILHELDWPEDAPVRDGLQLMIRSNQDVVTVGQDVEVNVRLHNRSSEFKGDKDLRVTMGISLLRMDGEGKELKRVPLKWPEFRGEEGLLAPNRFIEWSTRIRLERYEEGTYEIYLDGIGWTFKGLQSNRLKIRLQD